MNTPFFRPTYATINLAALEHNYNVLKSLLPKPVEILAMVKADGYGHGAVHVSKRLQECGACALGVATVEEGLELRGAGISIPILVIGGLMGMGSPAAAMMIDNDLTPVIHSADVVDFLEAQASSAKKRIAVHIKVDTGMSRLGVRAEALPRLLERLSDCDCIFVEGVMTHLANAYDDEFTSHQARTFLEVKQQIEARLGAIDVWHISNSVAAIKGNPVVIPGSKRCWARCGIALYGTVSGIDLPKGAVLKAVMQIKSRVALLKHVPAGTPVSYGCTFVTKRPSHLAVVPIGYADGYPLSLSGRAQVLVRGRRFPVVGRVTMDMIVVDVTDLDKVSVGDEVVLLGEQEGQSITVEDLARDAGTISYEILCGVSKRMPRIYI